ncbi:MAG: RNA-guided endonuclease TnpB family protein [Candidatus Woesearchaeota archaeon]|nr:RNA-guided endonuclease TnpB family protein [Candidatus Woesearchaeota archaeon]MDP7647726.1 RNA-guided endonuclease TnpB family protein [Candidatus Woesearchaeota archaeon]
MIRTYKFRLYPTPPQEKKLLWTLDRCRFVYDALLERFSKKKIKQVDLQHFILEIKRKHPELCDAYSKVLQYENYRLFAHLRVLSGLKRKGMKVGKLRFKGKAWFKTFTYNQSGFKIIPRNTRYDLLHLSKIDKIPFIMHREIEGKIKQVTIKKHASGRWFAFVAAESTTKPLPARDEKAVGIDLGITNFVFDSDGHREDSPKILGKSLKRLRRAQKRLSRTKKGSRNREKQKRRVARVHEKIVDQRNDFLHKLSRGYAKTYTFIAVEALNIHGMIRSSFNARNIMDASWACFVRMLEYKAESAGTRVIKVDPRGTTQTCSACGRKEKKELSQRTHECECGFVMDRDFNSALEILKRAVGQGLPEFTPVETGPLPLGVSQSVKQEPSSKRFLTGSPVL